MEFDHLQLRLLQLNHIDFIVIFAHFCQTCVQAGVSFFNPTTGGAKLNCQILYIVALKRAVA